MQLTLNNRRLAYPILPPSSPAVQRRVLATVHDIGALIGQTADSNPALKGCVMLPLANIVLAGTACARPQLFAEYDALAQASAHDLIVLRHDALRGTTFDIKLRAQPRWLRRYLATPVEFGLQMAPDVGIGPVLRVTAFGIMTVEEQAVPSIPSPMTRSTAPAHLVEA